MPKAKQSMDQMLEASARPQSTQSGSVILKSENRRHPRKHSSKITNAGEYHERQANTDLPTGGFEPRQGRSREGATEYIKMRSGRQ